MQKRAVAGEHVVDVVKVLDIVKAVPVMQDATKGCVAVAAKAVVQVVTTVESVPAVAEPEVVVPAVHVAAATHDPAIVGKPLNPL